HDVGRFALERPGGATAISRRLSIAIPPVLVATERTTNPVGFAAKARCDPSTVLYLTTIRRYRRRRSSTFGRGPRANGFHPLGMSPSRRRCRKQNSLRALA